MMDRKIKIKLSHPSSWENHGHWSYVNHFPGSLTEWGEFSFEINDPKCTSCDVWVVHESLDHKEKVNCPPENTILIVSEERQQVPHYDPSYLKQFGLVVTTRDDIEHPNVLRTFSLNPWRVRKTYDEIVAASIIKDADLSIVVSNNVSTAGHLKRYAFANRLKGHFKDRLNWFGKGELEIQDKWDGLSNFRYSIAIENCAVPYYFTEKIMDCYLAETVPIYYGCVNITDYFPENSLIQIDMDDFKGSVDLIEKAIGSDFYQKNLVEIQRSKDLVMNKYQFIPGIADIIRRANFDFSRPQSSVVGIQPKIRKPSVLSVLKKVGKRLLKD